ncbi:ESF1 homolog isoform X2 [Penaeus chinensis]|uniref:ESF1 homolog isoform X2 n=1 Tax=Penaeus chinensis TaxID=139456 RepID=UPI001FB8214A|nr:ESF1 homolog isoform X2 [Penaeus chinensis]
MKIEQNTNTNKMKGKKWKEKKKGKKASGMENDMEEVLADPRFAHVASDLRLRYMPKDEHKVKLDSRFSSVLTDDKFYEKYTMDPRGRKGNYSTKEDLLRFYRMSSDEESSDEEKASSADEDESIGEAEKVEVESQGEQKKNEKKDSTKKIQKAKVDLKKKEVRKEKWESVEDEEEEERRDRTNKEVAKIPKDLREKLQDLDMDYARGELFFSDDSSDDDSSTSDEDDEPEEFEWGELDQDAEWETEGNEVEETSRLALCNMDWDRIKAADIMKLFTSFCPRGGSVRKVTIYPSEFGKERMAEEVLKGPRELVTGPADEDDDINLVDLEKLEKGILNSSTGANAKHYETLRRYQRNRLLYYYAVIECDTIDTAKIIYKECDRQPFEETGILIDLRYIPPDMTFDDEVFDRCEAVPDTYEPKYFITTALQLSQPSLTWDEADPDRQRILSTAMTKALNGEEVDEEYLKGFVASGSECEDEESLQSDGDDESEDEDAKAARIAKFRALIKEIDEKENKKKQDHIHMEEMFAVEEDSEEEEEEEEDVESAEEDVAKEKSDHNPFEKYLEKRKAKKKEREQKKKHVKSTENGDSDESDYDDVPEGVDLNSDPYFAEEINKMKGEKKQKNSSKNKKSSIEETEGESKGDLELLLMDEDDAENKHFNMRDIIEDNKEKKKRRMSKNKKKLEKMKEKEMEKLKAVDDFEINAGDSRFSQLFSSGEYNIDPSHSQFKRTKAMDTLISNIQQKRVAETYENVPDSKRSKANSKKPDHELSLLVKRVKGKTQRKKC